MQVQNANLEAIADAIREKDGSTGRIVAADFPARIRAIRQGVELPELTAPAAAGDILEGKQAVDETGQLLTGTMPAQPAQTITPGAADQIIPAGRYLAGAQTIKGDALLLPDNIREGVSLFGVDGAYQGTDTSDATATATEILSPYTAYTASGRVTGTMPAAIQEPPSIFVSSSGLITASAHQTAGYMAAGTKITTKQLTTQAAATITPGTLTKTAVASGRYTTGDVTVAGDASLKAENIKAGVSVFGVTGTYAGTPGTLFWRNIFGLKSADGATITIPYSSLGSSGSAFNENSDYVIFLSTIVNIENIPKYPEIRLLGLIVTKTGGDYNNFIVSASQDRHVSSFQDILAGGTSLNSVTSKATATAFEIDVGSNLFFTDKTYTAIVWGIE